MDTSVTASSEPGRRRPTANWRSTLSHAIGNSPPASATIIDDASAAISACWPSTGSASARPPSTAAPAAAVSVATNNAERSSTRISARACSSGSPVPVRRSPAPAAVAIMFPTPVTMPTHMVRTWL